jgi:carbon monoxide dehydrogenase subunit G
LPTYSSFDAKNDDDDRVKGYVRMRVTDVKTDTDEGEITAFYVFPAKTSITVRFSGGPPATTKGDKTLEVAADDSSDDDDFEAV